MARPVPDDCCRSTSGSSLLSTALAGAAGGVAGAWLGSTFNRDRSTDGFDIDGDSGDYFDDGDSISGDF